LLNLNDYNLKIYDHSIPSYKAFNERNNCSKIFVLANRGGEALIASNTIKKYDDLYHPLSSYMDKCVN